MSLTIIILTHNSQQTIKASLKSALFADEVIIVDDNSTDRTLDIIEGISIKNPHIAAHNHFLHNNFAAQRNWAQTIATSNWIFFLDADEIITHKLCLEIQEVIKQNHQNHQGYFVNRTDTLLGKQLQYGETSNVKLLRLARKNAGTWNYSVHEQWEVRGTKGDLKNSLIHKRDISISQFLNRLNWYSTLKSHELYKHKTKESRLVIFAKPLGKFIYNYFFKRGFLDGFPGLCMAILMSWHSLLVRIKLQLLWLNNGKTKFK